MGAGEHPLELLDSTDLVCVSGGVPLTLPHRHSSPRKRTHHIERFPNLYGIRFRESNWYHRIRWKNDHYHAGWTHGRSRCTAPPPGLGRWQYRLTTDDQVNQIMPDDRIILELSSFQLELMTTSPDVAAVLNITPNHLDRHGTLEAYTAAKARILDFQSENSTAVLGHEDPGAWSLTNRVHGRLVTFGFERSRSGLRGTYLDGSDLVLIDGERTQKILPSMHILLRGRITRSMYWQPVPSLTRWKSPPRPWQPELKALPVFRTD